MDYYVQVLQVDAGIVTTRTWYSTKEAADYIADGMGEPDAEGVMTEGQLFAGAAASGASAYVRED